MGVKVVIGPVYHESLAYLSEIKDLTFLSLTNKTLDLPKNVISAGINSTSQLNTIEKYLINLRRSVYPEVFYTPELISRFKLLNVQITNTKIILNEFDKLTLVKEFDKIFQYFNNCNNIMKYIVENKSIIID